MNFFSWIIFGLIVGIIANLLDPEPEKGGVLGTIILGIVGALVGGLLANLVFGIGISGFNRTSFVVAILGSLFLLFVQRATRRVE